jgi:hypothetical protein
VNDACLYEHDLKYSLLDLGRKSVEREWLGFGDIARMVGLDITAHESFDILPTPVNICHNSLVEIGLAPSQIRMYRLGILRHVHLAAR